MTGRDDELLTVLEELRDRIVESARSADCFAIGQSNPTAASVEGSAAGLRSAARMVQDAINEHTPEAPAVWHCEAVAVGMERDAGICSPERQIHNAPCGWLPVRPEHTSTTDGCLEATRD